jgi:serine/threonine-protein kinase HipA
MISEGDYSATLENALSVAEYFEVSSERADKIISEVKNAVSNWRAVAKQLGISQAEINQMEVAFKK